MVADVVDLTKPDLDANLQAALMVVRGILSERELARLISQQADSGWVSATPTQPDRGFRTNKSRRPLESASASLLPTSISAFLQPPIALAESRSMTTKP